MPIDYPSSEAEVLAAMQSSASWDPEDGGAYSKVILEALLTGGDSSNDLWFRGVAQPDQVAAMTREILKSLRQLRRRVEAGDENVLAEVDPALLPLLALPSRLARVQIALSLQTAVGGGARREAVGALVGHSIGEQQRNPLKRFGRAMMRRKDSSQGMQQ